jgi:methionine synthase II (cobalamin-independent)
VQRLLDRWGTAPERAGERVILTPACGLAGSPPDWTRLVLRALAEAGRLLRDDGSTQSAGDRAGERAADDAGGRT